MLDNASAAEEQPVAMATTGGRGWQRRAYFVGALLGGEPRRCHERGGR